MASEVDGCEICIPVFGNAVLWKRRYTYLSVDTTHTHTHTYTHTHTHNATFLLLNVRCRQPGSVILSANLCEAASAYANKHVLSENRGEY
jgi:hypothetical protein